jgi:dihydroorotase
MSLLNGEMLTIPSPIDVHAHLREPGGTDKETIATGTHAARVGGYQAVFDMPNNPGGMQTWTEERLDEKIDIARREAQTSIGFYAGVDLENPSLGELQRMVGKAAGLKLYMGHTTGNIREHDLDVARPAIDAWIAAARRNGDRPPILLHAREETGEETAKYVASQDYPVHWCHISTSTEAESCKRLTDDFPEVFSAGITPHHLTMTERDADYKYGWNGARMMPPLGKDSDHERLVDAFNAGYIQILETDHAPHTEEDKLKAEADNPEGNDDVDCTTCFGVSGIEFVLPVMLSLVQRRKISIERLIDSLHDRPARLLGLEAVADKSETVMRIGPYVLEEWDRAGMSRNNPYVGWTAWGKVEGFKSSGRYQDIGSTVLRSDVKILRTGA